MSVIIDESFAVTVIDRLASVVLSRHRHRPVLSADSQEHTLNLIFYISLQISVLPVTYQLLRTVHHAWTFIENTTDGLTQMVRC